MSPSYLLPPNSGANLAGHACWRASQAPVACLGIVWGSSWPEWGLQVMSLVLEVTCRPVRDNFLSRRLKCSDGNCDVRVTWSVQVRGMHPPHPEQRVCRILPSSSNWATAAQVPLPVYLRQHKRHLRIEASANAGVLATTLTVAVEVCKGTATSKVHANHNCYTKHVNVESSSATNCSCGLV